MPDNTNNDCRLSDGYRSRCASQHGSGSREKHHRLHNDCYLLFGNIGKRLKDGNVEENQH
jgi:hypothetical protein